MSHFAKIDSNNIVIDVIVAEQDFVDSGAVGLASEWIQTSYNSNIRKNFAGIGHTYDSVRDAFYEPQPYPSWTLNETTCQWETSVAVPSEDTPCDWNEDTTSWVEVV
jgi:hypothetical protein